MKHLFRWLLWAWISAVILAAFLWAPLSAGFAGRMGDAPQSSRIVFFHVPLAVASFVAFMAAAVWSILYLWKRRPSHDHASVAAVEVGMVFCVLATATGAVWSEVQWGQFWNWDPRQTSIALALLFYAAYLSLRGAVEDPDDRARLSAVYSALGLAVAPFLFFIMPRMASFSLHPTPGSAEMEAPIGSVVLAGILGHIALFFWIQNLRRRMLDLQSAREA
ncbi:MAG: cytochrome c biogenesis protein [Holophagales bacterium]|nr:cytochrome c biogenesis protein [Holophagales bacterium]